MVTGLLDQKRWKVLRRQCYALDLVPCYLWLLKKKLKDILVDKDGSLKKILLLLDTQPSKNWSEALM